MDKKATNYLKKVALILQGFYSASMVKPFDSG